MKDAEGEATRIYIGTEEGRNRQNINPMTFNSSILCLCVSTRVSIWMHVTKLPVHTNCTYKYIFICYAHMHGCRTVYRWTGWRMLFILAIYDIRHISNIYSFVAMLV